MIEKLTVDVPFVGYKAVAANQQKKQRMRTWEDKLKSESSRIMGEKRPLRGDVRVVITACYLTGKSTHDIDRIAKLVLDGTKGIIINDDSRVKKLEVEIKERFDEDRTMVEIEAIQK